ncbi:hypothetical protein WKI68_22305 [Streptomyces sp. MS1.HAVA.3]|uniref:DUF1624 domain-containing protein n=1 Tax=Streptomyces caledonius TaxID=3134107 RepID=A0ABU8U676_9ACTN
MADTLLAPVVRKTARLPLLDVLRGAAVLGTLMTNVWIFASPDRSGAYSRAGCGCPTRSTTPPPRTSPRTCSASSRTASSWRC